MVIYSENAIHLLRRAWVILTMSILPCGHCMMTVYMSLCTCWCVLPASRYGYKMKFVSYIIVEVFNNFELLLE